ncbi:MAG: SRPBCC domain-containing protein [Caldilineaceae bacterium]
MRLEGTHLFAAPREAVWKALMDPAMLAGALPGWEQLVQTGENQYRAVMIVKVGPVQGRFEGKILLEDIIVPESYLMKVDGQGAPGLMTGEGRLQLEEADGGTLLRYGGDITVGGRIAGVGQRLIEHTAKSLTQQGLQALDVTIAARLAAPPVVQAATPPVQEISPREGLLPRRREEDGQWRQRSDQEPIASPSSLTGPQLGLIVDTIKAAYTRIELREILRVCMNMDFDAVVSDSDFVHQISQLVEWANRHGRVEELVDCAVQGNSTNWDLQVLYRELFHSVPAAPRPATHASDDLASGAQPAPSHHVFLAYSRKDAEVMRRLRSDLLEVGIVSWVDDQDLETGTVLWQRAIQRAIREARGMIVVLSPDANESEWVNSEITIGKRRGLRIFPVLARGEDDDAVPLSLTSVQYVDIRRDYQNAVHERLIPALLRLLGPKDGGRDIEPLKSPGKLTALFLAASPDNTDLLKLDEEVRAIDLAMHGGEFRDRFELRPHWAVRVEDLQNLLIRYKPHIVHFAGHGTEDGAIALMGARREQYIVPIDALTSLFSILKDNIRCVVLNACYSDPQARAIAQHVDCVVGMTHAVSDDAAREFSTGFYRGLAAGYSVAVAYDLGCNQVSLSGRMLDGCSEAETPRLLANRVDPKKLWLLAGPRATR